MVGSEQREWRQDGINLDQNRRYGGAVNVVLRIRKGRLAGNHERARSGGVRNFATVVALIGRRALASIAALTRLFGGKEWATALPCVEQRSSQAKHERDLNKLPQSGLSLPQQRRRSQTGDVR
jgi:hypothetical protein